MSSIQGNDPLIVSRLLSGEPTKLPTEPKNAKAAATKAAGKSQEAEVSKEKAKTTSTSQKSSATAIPTPDANGTTSTAKASRSFFSKQLSDTDLSTQDTLKKAYEDLQQSERNVTALQRQIKEYENNPGLSHEKKAKFIENANQRLRQAQFELGSVKNKLFTIQNKIEDSNKQIHAKLFKNLDKVLFQLGMKIQAALSPASDPTLNLLSKAETRLNNILSENSWDSEEEIAKVLRGTTIQIDTLKKTASSSPNESAIINKIKNLEEMISKSSNRFENDKNYRVAKVNRSVNKLFNLFGKTKLLQPAVFEALKLAMNSSPNANKFVEALLKNHETGNPKNISNEDLLIISKALIEGKKSLLEDIEKANKRDNGMGQEDKEGWSNVYKRKVEDTFGPALDSIQNQTKVLYKKKLDAASPEVRAFFKKLEQFLGLKFPIDDHTRIFLLDILAQKINIPSWDKIPQTLMQRISKTPTEKSAESSITVNQSIPSEETSVTILDAFDCFLDDLISKKPNAEESFNSTQRVITETYQLAPLTQDLLQICYVKGGVLKNAQVVTDSMALAVLPENLVDKGPAVRYLARMKAIKTDLNLNGTEKVLAGLGYIKSDYGNVWATSTWKKNSKENEPLKFTWNGGYALPEEPSAWKLKNVQLDLSQLGLEPEVVNQEFQLKAFNFIEEWLCIGNDNPEALKELQTKFMEEHPNFPHLEDLCRIAKNFTDDIQSALLESFNELGREGVI